jgi:hypothetical protein
MGVWNAGVWALALVALVSQPTGAAVIDIDLGAAADPATEWPPWWTSMKACIAAVALEAAGSDALVELDCDSPIVADVAATIHDLDGRLRSVNFRVTAAVGLNEHVRRFCAVELPSIPADTCNQMIQQRALSAMVQDMDRRIIACPVGSFVLPATTELREYICEQCYFVAAKTHQAIQHSHSPLQAVIQLYREVLNTSPTFTEAQFNLGSALQVLGDFKGGQCIHSLNTICSHAWCAASGAYETVLRSNPRYVEVR